MSFFHVDVDAETCNGSQTWEIEAESAEKALSIFNSGGGDIIGEEIEVTRISKPDLSDFYKVDQSHLQNFEGNCTQPTTTNTSEVGELPTTRNKSSLSQIANKLKRLRRQLSDNLTTAQYGDLTNCIRQLRLLR